MFCPIRPGGLELISRRLLSTRAEDSSTVHHLILIFARVLDLSIFCLPQRSALPHVSLRSVSVPFGQRAAAARPRTGERFSKNSFSVSSPNSAHIFQTACFRCSAPSVSAPSEPTQEAILAKVVKGFRSYLDIVGDAKVPQGFVVPDGEAWPQECRGQKLGEKAPCSHFLFFGRPLVGSVLVPLTPSTSFFLC